MKDIIEAKPEPGKGNNYQIKRTPEIWVLLLLFLFLATFGFLRMQQAIYGWNWFVTQGVYPGPFYYVASGALWGLLCLVVIISLWFRLHHAPFITRITSIILCTGYWLDSLLFSRSSIARVNYSFLVLTTIIFLFSVFLILAVPRQRWYFK